ncbi:MAG TPA: glucose 1-dehydrogenase [Acidobacteriota bacterium]|nr:glucose 1-dehydrogenase [Acidobacteriota bacterium]
MDFQGKTVVVTGASSGIGRATAERFAALGGRVVVHYNSNERGAMEACQNIIDQHGTAVCIQADLSSLDGVSQLKQATHRELGLIDILVNNAGSLLERASIQEMDEALYDRVMDLNLKSVFRVTRAFLPDMLAKGKGAIINVASIAGRTGGGPGAGIYATAKAAVICLTKAMAKEFVGQGIRVNAVNPGIILTPFHEEFTDPDLMQRFIETIPMKRGGTPDEVATVITFLASEEARYLTGETIEINGGQLMD